MSKLTLEDADIKQAIATYYEEHHTMLHERYDFENIEVMFTIDHSVEVNPFDSENMPTMSVVVEERKS